MKWRGVRVAVALLLLCAPAAGDAQPSTKMPRIGLMSVGTDPARPLSPYTWVAFLDGLRALGYVEGQNIAIERRFAGGKFEKMPDFAAELVQP